MFFHILHDEWAIIVFNFGLHIALAEGCTNTGVPPYPLFEYPWFQLSAVHHGLKNIGKLKK
jgi:hypothetical protein